MPAIQQGYADVADAATDLEAIAGERQVGLLDLELEQPRAAACSSTARVRLCNS
jgi:hypothetical protein